MLVLSRKPGEEIKFMGLDITVTVVEVKRNGVVRLGIVAPKEVQVKRGEIVRKADHQQPVVKSE